MRDKKEQLRNAIINNDIEEIRSFYEYIFMEKAPEPRSFNNASLKAIIDKAVSILTSTKFDDDVNLDKVEVDEPKASKNGVTLISSSEFELPEDSNPAYKAFLEKQKNTKKIKDRRSPYTPNIKKCASCSSEFDFNKEYPSGLLESGTNAKLKCNKCRSSS